MDELMDWWIYGRFGGLVGDWIHGHVEGSHFIH